MKSLENPPERCPRKIRRMFADISPRYDLLNHVLSLNRDRAWRRRTVRELGLAPGSRVLDVCTGTGDLAIELARCPAVRAGGAVVGADFTPEMLRIGERKLRRLRLDHVTLVAADTLHLPFADGTFDAVTVAFGIRNVCDLSGALREMLRVLRPGGQAAILEFAPPRGDWLRRAFEVYFRRVLPRIGALVSGSRAGREAYEYLPRSVGTFPPPEELSRLLEECGFVAVRCVRLTLGVAVLHVARRPSATKEGAEP
jgi:demethylmenaquinone methyltransferase / 2-methoxy-6-polyprenyl-1,4-benzoquinol methylase